MSPARRLRADVVVVGGGLAGLLAAGRHARRGESVVLLERSDRVGGRLAPLQVAGVVVDGGAEAFAARGGTARALAGRLGLGAEVVTPTLRESWIATDAGEYRMPASGWLGVPARPWERDVRRAVGWAGAARASLDLLLPAARALPGTSWGGLVERRSGRRVRERLVDPVTRGVYSRASRDLTLADVAPGGFPAGRVRLASVARSRVGGGLLGLRGGVWRLAEAAEASARSAGAELLTGVEAAVLERVGAAWRLSWRAGAVEAGRVVLATEPAAAARLLGGGDGVSATEGTGAEVTVVSLAVRAPGLDDAPRGTGVLSGRADVAARALTHTTAKWGWAREAADGLHLLRLSYDGARPGGELVDRARVDAAVLLGVALGPDDILDAAVRVWPAAAGGAVDVAGLPGVSTVGAAAGLTGIAAIAAEDERLR